MVADLALPNMHKTFLPLLDNTKHPGADESNVIHLLCSVYPHIVALTDVHLEKRGKAVSFGILLLFLILSSSNMWNLNVQ